MSFSQVLNLEPETHLKFILWNIILGNFSSVRGGVSGQVHILAVSFEKVKGYKWLKSWPGPFYLSTKIEI